MIASRNGYQELAGGKIEAAVGVLMELSGCEAMRARTCLLSTAVSEDLPVATVADAVLSLRTENRHLLATAVHTAIEQGGTEAGSAPLRLVDPGGGG